MDGIDGLAAGDPVTASRCERCSAAVCTRWPSCGSSSWRDPTSQLRTFRTWRGWAPFKIVDNDLRPFRVEVAKRIAALNTAIGWPADASIAAADRARVRTQVAREFFLAEHGRSR